MLKVKTKEKSIIDFLKVDWKPADLVNYIVKRKEVYLEDFSEELDPIPILFKFYLLVTLITLAVVSLVIIACILFSGELVPIVNIVGLGLFANGYKYNKLRKSKIYKRLS